MVTQNPRLEPVEEPTGSPRGVQPCLLLCEYLPQRQELLFCPLVSLLLWFSHHHMASPAVPTSDMFLCFYIVFSPL